MSALSTVIVCTLLAVLGTVAHAQPYREPPPDVVALLNAPQPPVAVPSPGGRYLLLAERAGMPSAEALARAEVSVAGVRLDPAINAPRGAVAFTGASLVDLRTRERRKLELPGPAGYPLWSPDGSRFAFPVRVDGGIALWQAAPGEPGGALAPRLNAALGAPCAWMRDSRHLLCRSIPRSRGRMPREHSLPTGPLVLDSGRLPRGGAPATDEQRVLYYLRSQLVLVDVREGSSQALGEPGLIESATPSPDGRYFLVSRVSAAYAGEEEVRLLPRLTEVWDERGRPVRKLSRQELGEARSPRGFRWRGGAPATLVWRQGRRAGDALLALPAPFTGRPVELLRVHDRISGVTWLEGSPSALVRTYDPNGRVAHLGLVDLDAGRPLLREMRSRNIDDPSRSLGQPLTTDGPDGRTASVHDGAFFLAGEVVVDGQTRSYLDRVAADSLASRRVWLSPPGGYEVVEGILSEDGPVLLTRRETPSTPPAYVLRDLGAGDERALTRPVATSYPLQGMRRVALHYRRADKVQLSAVLDLPPGYRSGQRLPLVMWLYPRRYARAYGGTSDGVPQRFLGRAAAPRVHFVLDGYAVMDEVAMPVIGSDGLGNDSFVEQIVADARAAIEAAAAQGFIDPDRVGVAGHSYGAFAVANLLVHSRLFKAGVALSGAYNRTLTPFGFQTEHRSLWDARSTYLAMSPFLYIDRLGAPLLLIHGARDENPGTPPMQSMRLYDAIRGNGGEARLVILPLEGHNFRARESVLHIAAEMREWFDTYLKGRSDTRLARDARAVLTSMR